MSLITYWNQHGTKLIGFAVTAVGALEFIDTSTLRLIETALGPQWGQRVSHGVLIVSGLATAWRGFKNSARNNPPPPSGGSS